MNLRMRPVRPFPRTAVQAACNGIRRDGAVLGFLAYVGSSSAFYNSLYNVGTNNRVFYGDGYANHALWRLGGGVTLLRNPANADAYHFGQTGATMQQILTATTGLLDRAIAQAQLAYAATGRYTLILAQPGLNNIGADDSAATIYGLCEQFMSRVEAAGPAVRLAWTEAWPRLASETNAAARLAVRLALNVLLRAGATARGHGVIPCESIGDDGSGFLLTTWSDAVIPGHGTMPFASRTANRIFEWISANCRYPRFNLWDLAAQMVPGKNAELAGNGGTGGRPTGWGTGNNAGTDAVFPSHTGWSVVDYGDGTGRKWFRFPCNANGSNGNCQLNWAAAVTAGINVGDTIDFLCEVRFPDPSGFAIGAIDVGSFMGGTFLSPQGGVPRNTQQLPPIGMEYHADTMLLRAPTTIFTGGTTSFDVRFRAWGSGIVDVGTPCAIINGHLKGLPQHFL